MDCPTKLQKLLEQAKTSLGSLRAHIATLGDHEDYSHVVHCIDHLTAAFDSKFDVAGRRWQRQGARSGSVPPPAKLMRSLRYQIGRRQKAEEALAYEQGAKQGLRLQTIWLVRVGLSPPTVPSRT